MLLKSDILGTTLVVSNLTFLPKLTHARSNNDLLPYCCLVLTELDFGLFKIWMVQSPRPHSVDCCNFFPAFVMVELKFAQKNNA
jgi:hypothetical protein